MLMIFNKLLFLCLLGSVSLMILGYIGRFHPAGDSLSILRPIAILASGIFSLFWIRRLWAIGLFSLAFILAAQLWLDTASPIEDGTGNITHYQKNMSFRMDDASDFIEDVLRFKADFLTLQEVTAQNYEKLEPLFDLYPTRLRCPYTAIDNVVILSKHPRIEGSENCHDGTGAASLQITLKGMKFWITSLHTSWPYPHEQPMQMADIYQNLKAMKGAGIIGGDFNMVPWGHIPKRIERLYGRRVSPVKPSFYIADIIPLPIDHIYLRFPYSVITQSETRPAFGSDHKGVVVKFLVQ